MFSQWLPRCRFYLRRLMQMQPVPFSAVLVASALLILALGLYGEQLRSVEEADEVWRTLNHGAKDIANSTVQSSDVKMELPAFDNTQLLQALNSAAESTKLSLDEISFAMDDNVTQPYLQYHATLTVTSNYPAIRRFLVRVQKARSEVSLDSIVCTRDDVTTVDLTCDLALSAFYRKDAHG